MTPEAHLLLRDTNVPGIDALTLGWRDEGLTVRLARGRKMRIVDGLFDELAAALQFPAYFGENWAAFNECLSDMDWSPTGKGS